MAAGVVKSLTCSAGLVQSATGGLVSYADIQNVTTARLLGRSSAGAGVTEEITIGSGLSLAAGTLSATAAGGTVTSVAAAAPAAGLTISGSPITTSGTLTFALANDLAALEALSGTNTIYYRSGADTWSTVVIGSGLSFSGGTLAATGGSGTVTSVGITAPAAGITVSGSPITTAGNMTLALANDLAALEAVTGTNTLYYRSGVDAWSAVAIGSGLNFALGTLSSTEHGTVTSVGLSAPATFTVSGSPVTSSGTLTFAYATQTANTVLAGPASGGAAAPTFRALVAADLPAFVAAGASHAAGAVPDPGATAHTSRPYYLGDDATFHKLKGEFLDGNFVATFESTTSTTAVDLTTAQSFTFSLDESSDVLIQVAIQTSNTTANANGRIHVSVDGTVTQIGATSCNVATNNYNVASFYYALGLAAGSHTIKLQFSVNTGTGSFGNRGIALWRAR